MRYRLIFTFVCLLLTLAPPVHADSRPPPDVLQRVGFDQRLNQLVPLEAHFVDEAGRSVRLGSYFRGRPVVLALGYYACPNLCGIVFDGMVKALGETGLDAGKDYGVVIASIDPREGPDVARRTRAKLAARHPGLKADAWHLLTGDQPAIAALAQAVGFRYFYDEKTGQYVHASGILVLTPRGRVSHYFYGVSYDPRDLRLGLVDASAYRIGNRVDLLVLLCCHYDPTTGKYSLLISNVMRLLGGATVLVLGAFILLWLRRERAGRGGVGASAGGNQP
jgi:protein SCO1/2